MVIETICDLKKDRDKKFNLKKLVKSKTNNTTTTKTITTISVTFGPPII